jgi:hypothetical protein
MRRAGQGLKGSAAAAAGGSALSEPGPPFGGLLTDRAPSGSSGGWTADGVSCPLRREHLFIRSQGPRDAVEVSGKREGRRCRCCMSATTGLKIITISRSRTRRGDGSLEPGCRKDWRESRDCTYWWPSTRRASGQICRQSRSPPVWSWGSRPTAGRGSPRW